MRTARDPERDQAEALRALYDFPGMSTARVVVRLRQRMGPVDRVSLVRVRKALRLLRVAGLIDWHAEFHERHAYRRSWVPILTAEAAEKAAGLFARHKLRA